MAQSVDGIELYMDGDGRVVDKHIESTRFQSFDLSTPRKVLNTNFYKCSLEGKRDLLTSHANLENVVFDDFSCGRVWIFLRNTKLRNIIFRGSKTRSLYVRPDIHLDYNDGQAFQDNLSVDISGFNREVDMVGIDPANVISDPSRHLKIDVSPFEEWDRRLIGQEYKTLVKSMISGVRAGKTRYGIFDVTKKDLERDEFVQELKKLAKVGALIDKHEFLL